MSFSNNENAIWYANNCSLSSPAINLLNTSAIPFASWSSIKHWHMFKKLGSLNVEYIFANNRNTCCRNSLTDTKLEQTFIEYDNDSAIESDLAIASSNLSNLLLSNAIPIAWKYCPSPKHR